MKFSVLEYLSIFLDRMYRTFKKAFCLFYKIFYL